MSDEIDVRLKQMERMLAENPPPPPPPLPTNPQAGSMVVSGDGPPTLKVYDGIQWLDVGEVAHLTLHHDPIPICTLGNDKITYVAGTPEYFVTTVDGSVYHFNGAIMPPESPSKS